MNLVDDLGNDVAMAFLVEKKYTENLDAGERLALIRKIRETLRRLSPAENEETPVPQAFKSAGSRGG